MRWLPLTIVLVLAVGWAAVAWQLADSVVGLVNGLALGASVGLVALVTGQGIRLGLVVFLAMTGNLMLAGFLGAFIPLLMRRLGVDPAVASSVFVTPFTDMVGFALLLGLAGTILL